MNYKFYTMSLTEASYIDVRQDVGCVELCDAVVIPHGYTGGCISGVYDENGDYIMHTGRRGLGDKGYAYTSGKIKLTAQIKKYAGVGGYLGFFPDHFGHMLVDGSIRLWGVIDNVNRYDYFVCIAFNSYLPQYYYDFLSLVGIDREKLLIIQKPSQFECLVVPEPSYLCDRTERYVNASFSKAFDIAVVNSCRMYKEQCSSYDKVYFTRKGHVKKYRIPQFGDSVIDHVMEKNGFAVLDPLKLSLMETMCILSDCKVFASGNGTSAHNAAFCGKGTEQVIIFNRYNSEINGHQTAIDMVKGYTVTYVDVYDIKSTKDVSRICLTNELKQYLDDNDMTYGNKAYIVLEMLWSKLLFSGYRALRGVRDFAKRVLK